MSNPNGNWNPECIRQRFEIVKAEVVSTNTRHKYFLVAAASICMIIIISSIYFLALHESASKHVVFLYFAVTVFIAFSVIYIIVHSSEKCVSKLSFCLLLIDDRQQFFNALQQVSCGGDAIVHFLQFTDKATNIISSLNPAIPGDTQPPLPNNQNAEENHAK